MIPESEEANLLMSWNPEKARAELSPVMERRDWANYFLGMGFGLVLGFVLGVLSRIRL